MTRFLVLAALLVGSAEQARAQDDAGLGVDAGTSAATNATLAGNALAGADDITEIKGGALSAQEEHNALDSALAREREQATQDRIAADHARGACPARKRARKTGHVQ